MNKPKISRCKVRIVARVLRDKIMEKYEVIDFSARDYEANCTIGERIEKEMKEMLMNNRILYHDLLCTLYEAISIYPELDLSYAGSSEWLEERFTTILSEYFDVIDFDAIGSDEPGIGY